MNAGPAHSIAWTTNPYHHSVPLRSLSRSGRRFPIHITGTVSMTGTKMAASWRKRKPVHSGSQMYRSRNSTIWCRMRLSPVSPSSTLFLISSLDTCSMRLSPVCSVPSLSSSESSTKAAVPKAAPLAEASRV